MKPTRRIDHDGVVTHFFGVLDRLFCSFGRCLRTLIEYLGIRFSAYDFKLLDRRGAVNIARDKQRLFTLFFEL